MLVFAEPEILTSLIVCVGIFSTSDGAVSIESERSVFKAINKRPVNKIKKHSKFEIKIYTLKYLYIYLDRKHLHRGHH